VYVCRQPVRQRPLSASAARLRTIPPSGVRAWLTQLCSHTIVTPTPKLFNDRQRAHTIPLRLSYPSGQRDHPVRRPSGAWTASTSSAGLSRRAGPRTRGLGAGPDDGYLSGDDEHPTSGSSRMRPARMRAPTVSLTLRASWTVPPTRSPNPTRLRSKPVTPSARLPSVAHDPELRRCDRLPVPCTEHGRGGRSGLRGRFPAHWRGGGHQPPSKVAQLQSTSGHCARSTLREYSACTFRRSVSPYLWYECPPQPPRGFVPARRASVRPEDRREMGTAASRPPTTGGLLRRSARNSGRPSVERRRLLLG
jgi:hypothetical protein